MVLSPEYFIATGIVGLILYIACYILDESIIPFIRKKYFSDKKRKNKGNMDKIN